MSCALASDGVTHLVYKHKGVVVRVNDNWHASRADIDLDQIRKCFRAKTRARAASLNGWSKCRRSQDQRMSLLSLDTVKLLLATFRPAETHFVTQQIGKWGGCSRKVSTERFVVPHHS